MHLEPDPWAASTSLDSSRHTLPAMVPSEGFGTHSQIAVNQNGAALQGGKMTVAG
jgi:hypothetical protein